MPIDLRDLLVFGGIIAAAAGAWFLLSPSAGIMLAGLLTYILGLISRMDG
jgi:hypothetical protein|tara:strand:- start:9507 stop:9656 length:150 start_codon:yes stop_codon:yes gene_type:complete